MRIAQFNKRPSVAFLLALSSLWLARGIADTVAEHFPTGKIPSAQIAEPTSTPTVSPVLIERDTKAASWSLMLEFVFQNRFTAAERFEPHVIANCLLHDRFLFPHYLIYTETTTAYL
jgi:hypothetical protein